MVDNSLNDLNSHNVPVFSVGELSVAIKNAIEGGFRHIRVRGELSGFKRAASGHLYFALKDSNAVLDGVCWKGSAGRLGMDPQDGMEVIVTGRMTTYGGRSKYQIIVETMELAGQGDLLKMLEERRNRLAKEGLFDPENRQELPWLPNVIGVVTSPTGAVIRDILHRIADRFPSHVMVWPVLVQGETAARQITAAIEGFNKLGDDGKLPRPDVIIVARGGGSLEDLWAFNEENVVRAAAASQIPLISAIGHETDTTLIDFAADKRAPTPSAAAEMAVPVRLDLAGHVTENSRRMTAALKRTLGNHRKHLAALSRGLPHPARITDEAAQRLDDWVERFVNSLRFGLQRRTERLSGLTSRLRSPAGMIEGAQQDLMVQWRALNKTFDTVLTHHTTRFAHTAALLDSYSYRRTLDRGFALVRDGRGKTMRRAADITAGMALNLEFSDGPVRAVSGGLAKKAGRKKMPDKTSTPDDDPQGSLL